MARMILLGTGTGLPDPDRDHTHMVWEGASGPWLIDAGGSTYQRLLRAGLDPLGSADHAPLQGVLLTHSHCDHINGLPALLFSLYLGGRTQPLPIYGLKPTLEIVRGLLAAAALETIQPPIEWREFAAGDTLSLGAGEAVQTAPTVHSRPCVALRFADADGQRHLVYSADTEPCAEVLSLASGAQVLIHEATTKAPFAGHTTPRQAGEVAAAAQVEHLVLVHYSPRWTMPITEALAEVQAGGFTGLAEIGQEYQVIEL